MRSAQANAALVRAEPWSRRSKDLARSKELLGAGPRGAVGLRREADRLPGRGAAPQVRARAGRAGARRAQAGPRRPVQDHASTRPMSGTVSELNKEAGEIALGSQFQADVILVIADLSEMEAQVNVDENDIVDIRIGQPAEIQVDALPGQAAEGDRARDQQQRQLLRHGHRRAEDRVRDQDRASPIRSPTLRPGMTATADIVTKTNENALSVPLQCVALRTVDQLAQEGREAQGRRGALQGRPGRLRRGRVLRRGGEGDRPGRSRPASRARSGSRSWTGSRRARRSSRAATARSRRTSRTARPCG